MTPPINPRHPMRAVTAAKTKDELLAVLKALHKMDGVDRGVIDAASSRLTALSNPPRKTP